jgi:hypothetical protein
MKAGQITYRNGVATGALPGKYAAENENIVPILWPDAAWPDGHHGHQRLPTLLQRAEVVFSR